jgi:uncharacterized membrane protein
MWPDSVVNNLKIRADNHCILLYADFKLHLRMAWEKKAYWFTDVTKQAVRAPVETKTYLKQIINTQVNNLDPMVPLIEKMFRPEQKVNLKQFVQSKMLDGFDPPNSAQLEFLDRWNSIQPKKVKRVLSSK